VISQDRQKENLVELTTTNKGLTQRTG